MRKRTLYYILLYFCAAVFLVSSIYIVTYFIRSSREGSQHNELIEMLESLQATLPTEQSRPTDPDETGSTLPPDLQPNKPLSPTILPEYLPFYQMNNHMVGWLNIPGTRVNYPVVQSPETPDFYLKYNFNKQRTDWGAIYVREVCDVNAPSDNITIYGHHMKDGSMFTGLDNYKKKSFWEGHKTFTFDTLYEHHTYEIFAVFKTSANYGEGFYYHLFVDAADEAEYNEFVSTVKNLSFYDTGITPVYGEKLICLSTCEYTLSNGRFVVVGRRIK